MDEDLKILDIILDKLTYYYHNDNSSFRCEYADEVDDFCDSDGAWFKARSKHMNIKWNPSKYSWTPDAYSEDSYVQLQYDISCQTVSIKTRSQVYAVFVDGGSKNKEMKKKLVQLFRAIEYWQEKEIPRRQRESFIDNITRVFPDIFDTMILEDIDEQEAEEGDT